MPQVLSEYGRIVGVSNVDVQFSEMPVYTSYLLGEVIQYVGDTNTDYIKGFFYERGVDGWVRCDVQPGSDGQPNTIETISFNGSAITPDANKDVALVQVNADWAEEDTADPSYIENKPTLGTASTKDVPLTGNASTSQVVMGNDTRLTDARIASDVSAWAKESTKPSYDYTEIQNLPTLGTASAKDVPASGDAANNEVVLGNDSRLTDARNASDVYEWAKSSTKPSYAYSEISGLGTVAVKDVASSGNASTAQVVMGNDTRLTDARNAADVYNWAKADSKPSYSASEISGLGTAAVANTTTSVTSGSSDLVTSGAVWTAIDNLPEPMIYKGTLGTGGTITTLPSAASSNEGYTYKVITAGTYQSIVCKVGDVVVSNGSIWTLIPAGDTDSDTWRNIKINGTEQFGSGISTGAIDFVNGTNTTVAFNSTGNKVSYSVAAVSKDSAGVAPKGAAVSTQSQSTKFLREDGTWAAPSYTSNTDRYVNSAAFADDSSSNASSPVKMTLTRAGSDSATVTGNIPKVSSSSAGVAPKGAAVSSQSQSTKFLREDGTWAAPSYTTNTDTKVTSSANHYAPSTASGQDKTASASGATAAWSIDVVKGVTLNTDGKGHVTGMSVTSGKIPANPNTDTKVTSADNHYAPSTVSGQDKTASASGATAAWSIDVVKGVTLNTDGKGHVTGLSVTSGKIPANPNSDVNVTQTATTTNSDYEVLFSSTADNTTRTEGARKNNNLKFNPSTGNLQATQLNGVTIGSSPKFTDTTYSFSGTTFYSGNSGSAEHNANLAIKNGVYYYSSNGPATTLGASSTDGALYVQSYSDSWVGQIAQDYRNGNLFVRGKNTGSWTAWKRVGGEVPVNPSDTTNLNIWITT